MLCANECNRRKFLGLRVIFCRRCVVVFLAVFLGVPVSVVNMREIVVVVVRSSSGSNV